MVFIKDFLREEHGMPESSERSDLRVIPESCGESFVRLAPDQHAELELVPGYSEHK